MFSRPQLLTCLIVAASAAMMTLSATQLLNAQGTHLWTQSRIEEFEKGTPQGVAIGSDGQLREGPGITDLLITPSTFVWSVAVDKRGTPYLGTGSPAGDALPPLLAERAEVELTSVRGMRTLPLEEFLLGVKRTALAADELVTAVHVRPSGGAQTFAKVGPRNAMVIAICSLAVVVDTAEGEVRAAFGSAAVTAKRVTVPLADAAELPDRVAEAAAPIDDVRATADYRRHALRVLALRTLERCLRS